MAIIKQAKNITIEVESDYILQVKGKVQKLADKINIEATIADLVLASIKKVVGQGGKQS